MSVKEMHRLMVRETAPCRRPGLLTGDRMLTGGATSRRVSVNGEVVIQEVFGTCYSNRDLPGHTRRMFPCFLSSSLVVTQIYSPRLVILVQFLVGISFSIL